MIRVRLERGHPLPLWLQSLLPVLAVLAALALCSILVVWAGADLATAYTALFAGALGSRFAVLETFVKTAPLILTGLAVALAFRARFWNIGAEGQLYAGALAATWFGLTFTQTAAWLLLPLLLLASAAAGGVWALFPGLLKARLRVDDVVTTLLMNYIMLYLVSALVDGPWRDPVSQWPQSPEIVDAAQLPILLERSRFHFGIPLAFGCAALVWLLQSRTPLGYAIRAVGANPRAAEFGGIPTTRVVAVAAFLSGGLAGLAGAGELAGIQFHLMEALSPGYGYSGIVVAMLGGLHPVGVILAAFFFGTINNGAQTMSRVSGVPTYLVEVMQGVTLLTMLAALLLNDYRLRWRRS
ncbi:MAG: ABC transporter permease [Candidatus Rokubacteria bacterium]|nr:ABC transporter permease [Candidatus Rokubacteria bacterium]